MILILFRCYIIYCAALAVYKPLYAFSILCMFIFRINLPVMCDFSQQAGAVCGERSCPSGVWRTWPVRARAAPTWAPPPAPWPKPAARCPAETPARVSRSPRRPSSQTLLKRCPRKLSDLACVDRLHLKSSLRLHPRLGRCWRPSLALPMIQVCLLRPPVFCSSSSLVWSPSSLFLSLLLALLQPSVWFGWVHVFVTAGFV